MQTVDVLRDRYSDSLFVPACVFREILRTVAVLAENDNFLLANLFRSDSTG